jgi:UDP-GlcNAc:undecaprenyl-phosphate GlcNAc-1-phosphate transferase
LSAATVGAVALAVSLAATPLAIVVARRAGIVDRPGVLKPQEHAVPYLGGLGVFAGMVVGVAAGRPTVLVPLTGALLLGIADDRFDLPAPARLVGQLLIGAAVVVTCPVHLPAAAGAVLIPLVAVVVINGVNLIDGLDMLAAGVSAVAAVAFALALQGSSRLLAVALVGALLGFLFYNRPPARVYLGDGGSYLLGTALTVLLAGAWAPGRSTASGVAVLVVVALPAAEVACAVVRRRRGRTSLMSGDRGHPYDRLVDRGWPPTAASLTYSGVEAVLVGGALLAIHSHSMAAAIAVDLFGAVLLVALAMATGALVPDRPGTR